MQIQNDISHRKEEVWNLIQKCSYEFRDTYHFFKEVPKIISEIELKIYDVIINNPLGCLGQKFIHKVNENWFKQKCSCGSKIKEIWNVNIGLDSYINATTDGKAVILKYIDLQALETKKELESAQEVIIPELYKDLLQFLKITQTLPSKPEALDQKFIKLVYLSEDQELIRLFKQHLPVPPIHIFDANHQPAFLVQLEKEKQISLEKFIKDNVNDIDVEKKLIFLQRHIRAKIRRKSEIKRIGELYFSGDEMIIGRFFKHALAGFRSKRALTNMSLSDLKILFPNLPRELAIQEIDNANKPYTPKCSPELAIRILKAATQVKLFSMITHYAAADKLASIFDGCLYGRENLINTYTNYRPAALSPCDVINGDSNVICFGMDKIDPRCLVGDTIGLSLDLDALKKADQYNRNPAIFFKQLDFGYLFEDKQRVKFKNKIFYFNHTHSLGTSKEINLRIYLREEDHYPAYDSTLPKYNFMSNNLQNMDAILSLNFFRFIDTLNDRNDFGFPADDMIETIYNEVAAFNDQELVDFLTGVGRKLSCSGEFNFSGAYKIDLDALKGISLYAEKVKCTSYEMDALYEELSVGKSENLQDLENYIPEALKSQRFKAHLLSKYSLR